MPPDQIDMRTSLHPARDQGDRGTCVAFAVTCAHELYRADQTALSEDALYWGCKTIDGDWDDGTSISCAAEAIERSGQATAMEWPYDALVPQDTAFSPPASASSGPPWRLARMTDHRPQEDEICRHLADGRAVILGMNLTPQWWSVAGDGALADLQGGEQIVGQHAVAVVGYERPGLRFVIRNSWGAHWGDAGYALMPAEYLTHVLEAYVVFAVM